VFGVVWGFFGVGLVLGWLGLVCRFAVFSVFWFMDVIFIGVCACGCARGYVSMPEYLIHYRVNPSRQPVDPKAVYEENQGRFVPPCGWMTLET